MSKDSNIVPFERNADYIYNRAMKNLRDNNVVDAIELMRHAINKTPDNQKYKLDLAEMYSEIGYHEQSDRLLLDVAAKGDAPAECFYTLAVNRVNENDLAGAKRALESYKIRTIGYEPMPQAELLDSELEFYGALDSGLDRKQRRAYRMAENACELLRREDMFGARRLFERSLNIMPLHSDTRALYAMVLMLCGEDDNARSEARKAIAGKDATIRSMCVAANVLSNVGAYDEAVGVIRKIIDIKPRNNELRMLIYAMCEMNMYTELMDSVRLALQETPYDKLLMHIMAVSVLKNGGSLEEASNFWLRILRIDSEDTVAGFFHDSAAAGILESDELNYEYQVPEKEREARLKYIVSKLGGGIENISKTWNEEPRFRMMLQWALSTGETQFVYVAMAVYAAIDDENAVSLLREALYNSHIPSELKSYIASIIKFKGYDLSKYLPPDADERDGFLPDADEILSKLPVGQRQLIRLAGDIMEAYCGRSALSALAIIWCTYREGRKLFTDPLIRTEAAAAALVYNYLIIHGEKEVSVSKIIKLAGCTTRQFKFFSDRMNKVILGQERG